MICSICQAEFSSNAKCIADHFVCDECHQSEGFDYIERFCKNTENINPIKTAIEIMRNPKIKMHGPEHHFLVPAVLINSYYNKTDRAFLIADKINVARERAKHIRGGFCGMHGTCGAAVGTGIYISIISGSTPMKTEERGLSLLMTSLSLEKIAKHQGPRCCKRETYTALESAIAFTKEQFQVDLENEPVGCDYYQYNRECKAEECPYFEESL